MIQIQQVSKRFAGMQARPALDNVHLTVGKGSIYGLLGSNGAGKTTLIQMLVGIYQPDSGSITIGEQRVFEHVAIKQKLVFIPDELYFFPQSTILEMARFYKGMYPTWDDERFETLQEVFQLKASAKLHSLSKGMKRQAAFWLALSCKPDYFVLDEPLDGLDSIMRTTIKKLLFQEVAERGMTVLLTSHNLREIEDLCDHIGILHEGKVVVEHDLEDLKAGLHKVQIACSGADDVASFKAKLEVLQAEQRGSLHSLVVRSSAEALDQLAADYQPLVYERLPLTLEEIFMNALGGKGYEISDIFI